MTTTKLDDGDLVVSTKVLGHISEGLYRGPAGAFKEMVCNSFDANALHVWISTGRPSFDVVSVRDDGDGMTYEQFIQMVKGGIGDSNKRIADGNLINGRKVIGRLGIGILAVSQISHTFQILSHHAKTETAFRAEIRMRDYRKEVLDQDSGRHGSEDQSDEQQGFSVGNYEVETIDFDPKLKGVTITATDPTEGFRAQLSEENPEPLPKNFATFIAYTQTKDALATGDTYRKMVWEIASLLPIPYLPGGPVAKCAIIPSITAEVGQYDFNVIFDGVRLLKPVLLPGPVGDAGGPIAIAIDHEETIFSSRLRVKGYIYGSKGQALHPDGQRGVLIRIRHVGIGSYDKSLLDYRYAEGPRFAWLSGELFVEEGLEDALTVGRDGFDAGHPHYVGIRKWFHVFLREQVFPELYLGIAGRRTVRDAERKRLQEAGFDSLITGFMGTSFDIQEVDKPSARPVEVDQEQSVILVNKSGNWPRGRKQRDTAVKLSIIFELVRIRSVDQDADPLPRFLELTKEFLAEA